MTCGAHQDDVVPALRRLRARPPGQSNGKGFQGTAPCRCPDSRKGLTSRARSSPAGADPGTPGFAGSAGASLQGRASATESVTAGPPAVFPAKNRDMNLHHRCSDRNDLLLQNNALQDATCRASFNAAPRGTPAVFFRLALPSPVKRVHVCRVHRSCFHTADQAVFLFLTGLLPPGGLNGSQVLIDVHPRRTEKAPPPPGSFTVARPSFLPFRPAGRATFIFSDVFDKVNDEPGRGNKICVPAAWRIVLRNDL